jgi:uncharacterized membrane protein (UPF0127 family)
MARQPSLVTVWNTSTGSSIACSVRLADTSLRRAIGLLGTSSLMPSEGLWIVPCSGVHTVGMSFAIDVIGLDREQRVVRLWPELKPLRLTALSWSMHSVLELSSGTIHQAPVRLGDQLHIQEVPPIPHATPA